MSIALKFTSLLAKTLSKPIANAIKSQAKQHPTFRNACIKFAQGVHKTDIHLRMKLLGETQRNVRPLNDAKAIDRGANFLSEAFIFSVAGGLIFYESYKSRKKEQLRQENVADDIKTLQEEIELLKKNLKENKIKIDEYRVPPTMKPSVLKISPEESPSPSPTPAPPAPASPLTPTSTSKLSAGTPAKQ